MTARTSLVVVLAALGVVGASASVASAYSVTTTADAGPGSLRQAILDANAHPGRNQVRFALPGSGVRTIQVTSAPLPTVTEQLVIDGRSQPGFTTTPLVRVDNATGNKPTGLSIAADQSKVLALEVTRFGVGVRLAGDDNVVAGNLVGTDAAGIASLGNTTGVRVATGTGNRIGGTGTLAPNTVSGNANLGIEIVGAATIATRVLGNRIGTNPAGTLARPNAVGVRIAAGSTANTIGGTGTAARNLISGNATDGVQLVNAGTSSNVVSGNFVGTDSAGTGPLPNATGVRLASGASSNTIGGTVAGARNVISANTTGVEFVGGGTTGNAIAGNFIGVEVTGTAQLANGDGVFVESAASGNTIGGTAAGAGNVISGNDRGIFLTSANNTVAGNLVGTDAGGDAALGNATGIWVEGGSADGNTIGGTTAGARNVISGNGNGVYLFREADSNTIAGNYVGITAAGDVGLGNTCGVCLRAGGGEGRTLFSNTVGGTTSRARNVVSGNGVGVSIHAAVGSGAVANTVAGNYIGTDPTGHTPIANGSGVTLGASESGETRNNRIGGTTPGARNVISGNASFGVVIDGGDHLGYVTQNNVLGNYIGTNADGSAALPNGDGVQIIEGARAGENTVGGSDAGTRNVISGNTDNGVVISGNDAVDGGSNAVDGNYIGTKAGGGNALGNGGAGVRVDEGAQHGRVEANRIAFNAGPGVVVDGTPSLSGLAASGNSILGNSIYSNSGLGIDLLNGGNHDQAAPAITAVTTGGGTTTIAGTLASTPSTTFRIELFSSPTCDPSGAGEGKTFLGSTDVITDGAGQATFSATVAALPAGQAVTATATSSATHDTSEFSTCFKSV